MDGVRELTEGRWLSQGAQPTRLRARVLGPDRRSHVMACMRYRLTLIYLTYTIVPVKLLAFILNLARYCTGLRWYLGLVLSAHLLLVPGKVSGYLYQPVLYVPLTRGGGPCTRLYWMYANTRLLLSQCITERENSKRLRKERYLKPAVKPDSKVPSKRVTQNSIKRWKKTSLVACFCLTNLLKMC